MACVSPKGHQPMTAGSSLPIFQATAGRKHLLQPAQAGTTVDLFEIESFLDAATLAAVVAELHRVGGAPATVLSAQPGGEVRPVVRKVTRLAVSMETSALIKQVLLDCKPALAAHFDVALAECEEPQFAALRARRLLRGPPGWQHAADLGRFALSPRFSGDPAQRAVRAADARDVRRRLADLPRAVRRPDVRVAAKSTAPGTLITFRSETTHEVTMVTHGLRYSIATWLRGA